jgi:membrane-bound inhibitor of C-type lysozyme
MASREKASKSKGVTFTRDAADAIAETVRTVHGGNRSQGGMKGSGSAYAQPHYLSKTTAAWTKGTKATLTLHVGDGGSEASSSSDTVEAWNKWGDVASGEWVLLARANGTFYLAKGPDTGIKRGTFTAPWSKGGTASVSDAIATGTTYSAKNYFAAITGSGTKACAIAYVGTEWILIAAEC